MTWLTEWRTRSNFSSELLESDMEYLFLNMAGRENPVFLPSHAGLMGVKGAKKQGAAL
jgi:hypothetical protein